MADTPPPRGKDLLPRIAFLFSGLFLAVLYGFCAARYQWFPHTLLAPALEEYERKDKDAPDLSLNHVHRARHDLEGVSDAEGQRRKQDVVLVTSFWSGGDEIPGVRVIDRAGKTLHKWDVNPEELWPVSPHQDSGRGIFNTSSNYIHGSYLFENGDVLFNIEYLGLVRLDSVGNVVWQVNRRTHHSVTRDDDGNFWVCEVIWVDNESQRNGRFAGLDLPLAEDCALQVSPDGEILQSVSMLETVHDSELRDLLWRVGKLRQWDVLHMNDVEPLSATMAAQFPMFTAGDLLVSLRHIDAVLVVDPKTKKVKWSAHAPFMNQHDPDFQADGWISVFDNHNDGSLDGRFLGGSRLWTLKPGTDQVRQIYPVPGSEGQAGEREFYTQMGGKAQLLSDGHWLLTEAQCGRIFEIDRQGRTVWEWGHKRRPGGVTISEVLEGTSYPLTPAQVGKWQSR